MREPLVKFYKDGRKGGNGAFTTSTTARNPDEFLHACAEGLVSVLVRTESDEEFTFAGLLPQICEIWAKLKGYKADTVFEQRLLTMGEPTPEGLDLMNPTAR